MNPQTLISATALAALVLDRACLIVDCRNALPGVDKGRLAYAAAHIPAAVYADLDGDLSDLSKRGLGRHPLPDAAAFSATLSRWGWQPNIAVVAYDDAGGALAAARLWWMLRLLGSRDVAVLDGGIAAWRDAGLALTAESTQTAPSVIDIDFDARQMIGFDELANALAEDAVTLIDARATPRYRGDVEPLDRVAGHVPGALNRPFSANLDDNGRFKPAPQLRSEFAALIGARAPSSVVHMCGSGVTACHNLLAMEHAELAGSRVFAPSWSGWISDPARPIAISEP